MKVQDVILTTRIQIPQDEPKNKSHQKKATVAR